MRYDQRRLVEAFAGYIVDESDKRPIRRRLKLTSGGATYCHVSGGVLASIEKGRLFRQMTDRPVAPTGPRMGALLHATVGLNISI